MHIGGSGNLQATYTMASATLQTINEEKDLGIYIRAESVTENRNRYRDI